MPTPDSERFLLDRAEEAETKAEATKNADAAQLWRVIADSYRRLAAMAYGDRIRS